MLALLVAAEPPEGGGGGQIEQIARTFGVDWTHLLAQTISFTIVCALLYWLAYRPILTMLAARRQQIAQGLENAAKVKAELEKTAAQRQEVLAQARVERDKLIEDAHAAAARVQAQETQRALADAEQIVVRGREAAASDRARMVAELRRELGRLVVQTTASVTGKVLTPEDQRRLAEETAKGLAG